MYYELFKRNFPFIVRNYEEATKIINNKENKIIDVYEDNKLIACSIIHKDTILMLCVDKEYRNKGIGSKLLQDSEQYIYTNGYDVVKVGVSDNYLMPGIPMKSKPYNEILKEDKIYEEVNDDAFKFFSKRGYIHSWNANCFDMRADLDDIEFLDESIGDTIDNVTYRFATLSDILSIIKCTDDANIEFSKYYRNEELYKDDSKQKVLIALSNNEVCGTLIISVETEGVGLGSVGCTTVKPNYRGNHIGVNMVILGTKYLKSLGLKKGFLGYTYSGLDKMYGYSGYKICVYYMMAQKKRSN